MDQKQTKQMPAQISIGGTGYMRNLACAEAAVLRGQFNVAKILRALAHSQRVQALDYARHTIANTEPTELFSTILKELGQEVDAGGRPPAALDPSQQEHSDRVRQCLRDLVQRSLASVQQHPDVTEGDVPQSLWGCYGCGYIAEGEAPDACPVCGALGAEFEWFGPFYSVTPEHLGRLTPADIIGILEKIPDQVSAAISGLDDETLRRKPSKNEWCIKEILGHVIETDRLFVKRVGTILAEQGIPSVDTPVPPWKLQEGRGYEELSASQILERLHASRRASVGLLHSLEPHQWARRGTNRGRVLSLIDLGTWLANHDRGHLAQVLRPA